MNYYYFAVTVKNNTIPYDKLTTLHYLDWFSNAAGKGLEVLNKTYEFDEQSRLHVHAVCRGTIKNPWKQKFLIKNYHHNIQRLDGMEDLTRWMIYMYKTYDNATEVDRHFCIVNHAGIDVDGPKTSE